VPNDDINRLLDEIGQLIAEDRSDRTNDTLLHAELDKNYVAASIFDDQGDHIEYREGDLRLSYALLELWEAQEPDKRWAEIEYLLRDNKFLASFTYPDEIASGQNPIDRRDRIVAKHFGKKKIVYPPPPSDAMEYKP
jgi:hypothetical protein